METIGDALKYQREINGYTQLAVAKRTGIAQSKLSYCENGKRLPSLDDCIRLADFYGISLDELVGRDFI